MIQSDLKMTNNIHIVCFIPIVFVLRSHEPRRVSRRSVSCVGRALRLRVEG